VRFFLLAVVVVMLAAPALAQTAASPVKGKYSEVYIIAGRAIDSVGEPLRGASLLVELDQRGVTAEPLRAKANCKGDFLTDFNLLFVEAKGKAKITAMRPDGSPGPSTTVSLDPFFRRSDAVLRYDEPWNAVCSEEADVWNVSASLKMRLLNRTDRYTERETEFFARPYAGVLKMRYETVDGNTICPPHPQDQSGRVCEQFVPDERGDIKYTFTLDQPFVAGGSIVVIPPEGPEIRVTVDPVTRLGVRNEEMSGLGVPEELYDTPGPGVFALLAVLALLVTMRRRK